jgi:hypothetical protein
LIVEFSMKIDWEETVWAVGVRADHRVIFWCKVAVPKRQMAAMLREIADALETGDLKQVEE